MCASTWHSSFSYVPLPGTSIQYTMGTSTWHSSSPPLPLPYMVPRFQIRFWIRTDLALLPALDPDPVFQISLDPDPGTKKECRKGSKNDLLEENLKIMTNYCQKWKRRKFLIKDHHKIDGKFPRQRCLDPVLKKLMDPDPVCPERLDTDPVCPERFDPDPVIITLDPKPCLVFAMCTSAWHYS